MLSAEVFNYLRLLRLPELFSGRVSFRDFVISTALATKNTDLPALAESLILGIVNKLDESLEIGAIIRGGSMRSFLFKNYPIDEHFQGITQLNEQYFGNDELARAVVEKAFSLPKDIDVFFEKPPGIEVDDGFLLNNLRQQLKAAGYINELIEGNDKVTLSSDQYQVRLLRHRIGTKNQQTLVKVDFSDKDEKKIMRLHFGFIPEDDRLKQEDPRFHPEAADIDQLAVGFLEKKRQGLTIYFDDSLIVYLMKNFFNPIATKNPVEDTNPVLQIMARLREINFRVAAIPFLFSIKGISGIDADLQSTPYYKIFVKYGMEFERRNRIRIDEQCLDEFNDKFKLIATDILYGISVNPFLFFLFAFNNHVLDSFPLGQVLNFNKLRHYLEYLAESLGLDITKPLLDLSLAYYQKLRTNPENNGVLKLMEFLRKPANFSEFLKLLDIEKQETN